MTASPRELETIDQAARRHGVCKNTIRKRIAEGAFPAYRLGPRLIKLDVAEVDAGLLQRIPTA